MTFLTKSELHYYRDLPNCWQQLSACPGRGREGVCGVTFLPLFPPAQAFLFIPTNHLSRGGLGVNM